MYALFYYLVNATKPHSVGWSMNKASLYLNNDRQIVVSPPEHKILIKLQIKTKEFPVKKEIIKIKIHKIKIGINPPVI